MTEKQKMDPKEKAEEEESAESLLANIISKYKLPKLLDDDDENDDVGSKILDFGAQLSLVAPLTGYGQLLGCSSSVEVQAVEKEQEKEKEPEVAESSGSIVAEPLPPSAIKKTTMNNNNDKDGDNNGSAAGLLDDEFPMLQCSAGHFYPVQYTKCIFCLRHLKPVFDFVRDGKARNDTAGPGSLATKSSLSSVEVNNSTKQMDLARAATSPKIPGAPIKTRHEESPKVPELINGNTCARELNFQQPPHEPPPAANEAAIKSVVLLTPPPSPKEIEPPILNVENKKSPQAQPEQQQQQQQNPIADIKPQNIKQLDLTKVNLIFPKRPDRQKLTMSLVYKKKGTSAAPVPAPTPALPPTSVLFGDEKVHLYQNKRRFPWKSEPAAAEWTIGPSESKLALNFAHERRLLEEEEAEASKKNNKAKKTNNNLVVQETSAKAEDVAVKPEVKVQEIKGKGYAHPGEEQNGKTSHVFHSTNNTELGQDNGEKDGQTRADIAVLAAPVPVAVKKDDEKAEEEKEEGAPVSVICTKRSHVYDWKYYPNCPHCDYEDKYEVDDEDEEEVEGEYWGAS